MDKLEGKVKLVRLDLLRNLDKNIGNFVVSNLDKSVYQIHGLNNGYYEISDTQNQQSLKAEGDLINNFSSIFITCKDFFDPECQVLFLINGQYIISSPLDFMGNQIEEADPIFAFPYELGKDFDGNDLDIAAIQNLVFSEAIEVCVSQESYSDGLVIQTQVSVEGKILIGSK